MQNHIEETDFQTMIRQRSIRLFAFLQEFVQLRSKVTTWVDHYEKVIWLSDIPEGKGCYSIFRKENEHFGDSDVWLEVLKSGTQEVPAPPPALHPWLDPRQLTDPNRNIPELLNRIPNPRFRNRAGHGDTAEFLYLEEYKSQLAPLWKQYVTQSWRPWAERNRSHQQVQKQFAELYSIYQHQQKFAEAYEVVLGIGCLAWNTPGGTRIKRHLLTVPAEIAFDAERGSIAVGPVAEGGGLQLEQDMLEAGDRPDTDDQARIDKWLDKIGHRIADLWEMTSLLRDWLHSIPADGKFIDSLQPDIEPADYPQISLSPALILRKRTDQSLYNAYAEIIEQLKTAETIPGGVTSLVSIPAAGPRPQPEALPAYNPLIDGEIYFPLAANEAQRDIVRTLKRQDGVVVQGPPGTGKSQTIANLICHLLANGQRVLVTSHASRALQVLEQMLPESLASLAILALDDSSYALQKLEDSATGIIERYNHWEPERTRKIIKALRTRLGDARRTEARILRDLQALREVETYEYLLVGDAYSGNLASIARRLREEAQLYGWFPDRPEKEAPPPISDEEALELVRLLRKVGPEEEKILRMKVLPLPAMVPMQEFIRAKEMEAKARRRYDQFAEIRNSAEYPAMAKQPAQTRQRYLTLINKVLDTYDTLDHQAYAWVKRACSDILAGRITIWQTLHGLTEKNVTYLKSHIDSVSEIRISGLEGRDLRAVKEHASRLYEHLLHEGRVGIGPFRPRVVRESLYLMKLVLIDGSPCDTMSNLQTLLDYIEVADRLDTLAKHWSQHTDIPRKAPLSIQLAEYESLYEPLTRALELHESAMELREITAENPEIFEPHWHDIESIRHARTMLIANDVEVYMMQAQHPFNQMEKKLLELTFQEQSHPILERLLQAVRNRDQKQYHAELKNLHTFYKLREDFDRRNVLLNKLMDTAPKLLKAILLSYNDSEWDEKMIRFGAAWNWACAEAWLERTRSQQDQERLELEYETAQQVIRELLTKLTTVEAWDHCFSRMTEHERQHLLAWTKAVQRIGKGKGKYVNQHRKAAQEHLEECRSVIPAWIMPIYRVAETVRPLPEMFDVAIIDEASQSGPEALFLMYIAKQVVVVGDNNQISPDYVGISREDVDGLRQKYLSDIPHHDIVGVDNSFFDQAEVRFGHPIRLREHFRCMPEIIEFSNRLCYQTEPLIPLRQFGHSRLQPVVASEYIHKAFTQDNGGKLVNPLEAEALAGKIKDCCENPDYDGKTFGVISLQGTAQARYIEKLLINLLGEEEIEKRNLVCGDAYAFQGDERDVMFLSMVKAPDRRIGVLSSPRDERRFNVAVSRARDQVWLFHSVKPEELNSSGLRYRLLKYFKNPEVPLAKPENFDVEKLRRLAAAANREESPLPNPFESWFEIDIFLQLRSRGFRVTPKFAIDEHTIDLVVEGAHTRLAIECYGPAWNGVDGFEKELARQRLLERCGWQFWRIRSSEYYRYPERTVEQLLAKLQQMGIASITLENGTVYKKKEGLEILTEMN